MEIMPLLSPAPSSSALPSPQSQSIVSSSSTTISSNRATALLRPKLSASSSSGLGGSSFCCGRRITDASRSRCNSRYLLPSAIESMDEDSIAFPRILSSSEGEESDTELLFLGPPVVEVDLPTLRNKIDAPESALTLSAHSIISAPPKHKNRRIQSGTLAKICLMIFLYAFLLTVDWWAWRILRKPLPVFYLTLPFSTSLVLSACAGYLYVPMLRAMKIYHMLRKVFSLHFIRRATPTVGGSFFIPTGLIVANVLLGPSVEVYGATVATLALAVIGMMDDILRYVSKPNTRPSRFVKALLQVAVGVWFYFWLVATNISSPYNMKFLVPLPSPFGLVYIGKLYLFVTAFCFASMGNGVDLTDGLDGLAGGTAALALSGMSIAVLPICPDLAVFGVSMTGACMGFLCHNSYKTSIFMGGTGSLALGGALAAMAACTGMFFPLFVCSGVFLLEASSAALQVFYLSISKGIPGSGKKLFIMASFHDHFGLRGTKEQLFVASMYIMSCILSLCAAYIGFISA